MNKKYALIIAFLLAGLLISEFHLINFAATKSNSGRESVVISRVIDGDTLKLEDGRTIRLLNINSPEKNVQGSNLSSEFLNQFINQTVWVEIKGTDKYQRNLARIYSPDYLNLEIVKLGLASKFLVDENELSEFSEAEEYAVKNNLGIWKKSNFAGCFDVDIDKDAEMVGIKNKCPKINMKGWQIKDESRKIYSFQDITFDEIMLHSSAGIENSTDLFWQSSTNIWNSDRDTLYLFDSNGGIAHHESYGY